MRFVEVLGHENAIRDLRNALRLGRVHSAYLFVGPVGVGRQTLMRAFAAALLCHAGGTDACGRCASCRLLASDRHPDLRVLETEEETVSVDRTREFCRILSLRAVESARCVGLVPDADLMTAQAANSFLKTLEEPPGPAVLLLRSEGTDRLLKTIVSRSQVVRLAPLPFEAVKEALVARQAASGDEAAALARLAEGSLGRALALASGKAGKDWTWLQGALQGLRPGGALALADGLVERAAGSSRAGMRLRAQTLLDMTALFFRQEMRERKGVLPRDVLACIEAVWRASERLAANVNPELSLQTLALDLAASFPAGAVSP
ncbi:MAG: DNA polymerase III subunit delta' [Planctomycetota bacterium]